MDRRTFGRLIGLSALGLVATPRPAPAMAAAGEKPGATFTIGMVMFDGMTNLDLVGPLDMFARVRTVRIRLIAKTMAPVVTDSGTRMLADCTFADAPPLDLLFVGGGPGTAAMMEDAELLTFLRERGPRAQWITSVCTGALLLGAAGLLRGYRAASHWNVMDLLPSLGAIPVNERVVIDRNRATGGGVTAGIDFALTVIARIWGQEQAELIQLGSEYDPAPPFKAGSPRTAAPALVARFRTLTAPVYARRREAALRAKARLTL